MTTNREYENFDTERFFAETCGNPLSKSGKETVYKCPRSREKDRRIYVAGTGKWKCHHSNCSVETGCPVSQGGPRQLLQLVDPDLSTPAALERLKGYGRVNDRDGTVTPPGKEKTKESPEKKPGKIWPSLESMTAAMPLWSLVENQAGKGGKLWGPPFIYRAADGKEVVAVVRFDGPKGKAFVQARAVAGGWVAGGAETLCPLFRLPELVKEPGKPVYVVEGEKCVLSLRSKLPGAVVTTSIQGSKSPGKTDWSPMAGRAVVIFPDNDEPGREYAATVADLCRKAGAVSVAIAEPFYGRTENDRRDIADFIKEGGHPDTIRSAIEKAEQTTKDTVSKEDDSPPIPVLTIDSANCKRFFDKPKPREFIVSDFLPRLNVGIIAAPGGTGKGYLTLQLALSVAIGGRFLGKFPIENPGGVLYINAEDDDDEIHRRFLACFHEVIRPMQTGSQRKEAAGAVIDRFYSPAVTGRTRLSLFPDEKGETRRRLLELAKDIPDLRLVILDPANRLMAGDFNKVEEVTPFIQALEEIAFATGATVLLVTHTNKGSQGGDRDSKHSAGAVLGSQSFVNAARWVATLSTFDESMRRKLRFCGPLEKYVSLRIPKANYLKPGLGELHLQRIEDDESGFGGGPLRLVDLEEKRAEVTPGQVAEWVAENPGNSLGAVVEGVRGRYNTPKHRTDEAVKAAIKDGVIDARASGNKNQKLLFPIDDFEKEGGPENGSA